jgi:hypothetical protein
VGTHVPRVGGGQGSAEERARARLEDELDKRVQAIVARVAPNIRLERLAHGLCVLARGHPLPSRWPNAQWYYSLLVAVLP